ncbi:unnamed protein product [Ilex paraguariensis]|uniref:Uncharacterized protein n=1 Tax=Ilex paraguariensis TaxID=185542 RepID=A0ABC8TKR6_9AQUA
MWFSATYHKLLALHGEGRVEQNIVEAEEGGGQFRKCSCSSGCIPSEPCEVIYHPGRGRDLRWVHYITVPKNELKEFTCCGDGGRVAIKKEENFNTKLCPINF